MSLVSRCVEVAEYHRRIDRQWLRVPGSDPGAAQPRCHAASTPRRAACGSRRRSPRGSWVDAAARVRRTPACRRPSCASWRAPRGRDLRRGAVTSAAMEPRKTTIRAYLRSQRRRMTQAQGIGLGVLCAVAFLFHGAPHREVRIYCTVVAIVAIIVTSFWITLRRL